MLKFNDAISALALVEIPIKGRSFTWSNMQQAPLLEKLDLIFSSESWTDKYPNTLVWPLARPISDHIPCVIQIGTEIPKSTIFRFENYWMQHSDFKEVVKGIWSQNVQEEGSEKRISAKFKRLRKGLKIWSKNLSQLSAKIRTTNPVILLLDSMEEFRPLPTPEWNGRAFLQEHLKFPLKAQHSYWKQRATIRWIQKDETNTKFLQIKATIKYINNFIAVLNDENNCEFKEHDAKAAILHRAFKQKMGTSIPTFNMLQLQNLIEKREDLHILEAPFTKEEIDAVIKALPSDKAPGLDGFNSDFIKHCWDIIAEDFYKLIDDFFHEKNQHPRHVTCYKAITHSMFAKFPLTNVLQS